MHSPFPSVKTRRRVVTVSNGDTGVTHSDGCHVSRFHQPRSTHTKETNTMIEHPAPEQVAEPAPPTKSRRYLPWLLGAAILAGGAYMLNRDKAADAPEPKMAAAPAVTAKPTEWERDCPGAARRVKYVGDGTASTVAITAQLSSGTSQATVGLPIVNDAGSSGLRWCASPGDFLYISLQNQGSTGSVTCEIWVDGTKISRVTSSGAYVIAQCDGSA